MATMFTAVRTRLLLEAARLRVKQMGLETLAGAPSVDMALGELVNHSEFLEGRDLWEGCHGRIPRFSTVALWTFHTTPSFVVGRRSHAPWDAEQHLWPPSTKCQQHTVPLSL